MKRDVKTLDAAMVPLSGVNLIEANAGTGKTYSIASLYMRLVVTGGLSVDRILVVSFTEAATAELQERIRARLVSLRQALERGDSAEAHEAALLVEVGDQRQEALRRVRRALQSFDEAAIHTIHGFCQRLLAESAFEAGLAFGLELIPDDSAVRRRIVDDFWREHTADGSRWWLEWLYDETSPGKLTDQLGKYFARPLVRRLAPAPPDTARLTALEHRLDRQLAGVRAGWRQARDTVRALLASGDVMKQSSYRPQQLDKLFAEADRLCAGEVGALDVLSSGALSRLGSHAVERGTLKGRQTPRHELFDQFQQLLDTAEQLCAAYGERFGALRAELIEYAETELPLRKHALRVRHFDDLLNDVYHALQGASANWFRAAVRERYGAALIDEFQDTDPVQFAIFDHLFCANKLPVFFVGDPKQAIYSFRNADVYAYLNAREQSQRIYRLDENFRSTPELVDATNALFERPHNPFLLKAIGYKRSRAHFESMLPRGTTPMRWWLVEAGEGVTQTSAEARRHIAQVTASEIVAMLDAAGAGRLERPDGAGTAVPLQARDIAVLVRTHDEGSLVRRALAERGVSCVQRSGQSVFQTHEAAELCVVLNGIAHYHSSATARAALATQLLGFDAAALEALTTDDTQWQTQLDTLARLRETWVRRGFAPMHRALLRDFGVETRLLGLEDGKRRLTNLLHLEDLLQRESATRLRMPDELLAWLQSQLATGEPGSDASLLRLDSDENLVQIQTIHFSKGLQYPVVFCPYLWGGRQPASQPVVVFHDDDKAVCLDLGSTHLQRHREMARDEDYAEALRLAYVALTRAQLVCIAIWGSLPNVQGSPLAWLLHSKPGDDRASLQKRVKGLTHEPLVSPLRDLASGSVSVADLPPAAGTRFAAPQSFAQLKARVLESAVPAARRVSSYSALVRSQTEQPRDYDAFADRDSGATDLQIAAIADFPRGARAGRCIHSLFEHIAFDADSEEIAAIATSALEQNGFAADLAPVLTRMACDVVRTPLFADNGARLADIGADRRVDEMEFYFPTSGFAAHELRDALGAFGAGTEIEARLAALDFDVAGGHFHGFIDLVAEIDGRYYLFDYKSNWLGGNTEAYASERLVTEIARHDYYLQYLIYSVALHRHLHRSLESYDYARDFGGVGYLFVRGMQPQAGPGFGIYRDRPSAAAMAALEKALCGATS